MEFQVFNGDKPFLALLVVDGLKVWHTAVSIHINIGSVGTK